MERSLAPTDSASVPATPPANWSSVLNQSTTPVFVALADRIRHAREGLEAALAHNAERKN